MRFLGDLMVVGRWSNKGNMADMADMAVSENVSGNEYTFHYSHVCPFFRETMMIHQWLSLFSPYDKAPNWQATGRESQAEQSMGRFRIYDHI